MHDLHEARICSGSVFSFQPQGKIFTQSSDICYFFIFEAQEQQWNTKIWCCACVQHVDISGIILYVSNKIQAAINKHLKAKHLTCRHKTQSVLLKFQSKRHWYTDHREMAAVQKFPTLQFQNSRGDSYTSTTFTIEVVGYGEKYTKGHVCLLCTVWGTVPFE